MKQTQELPQREGKVTASLLSAGAHQAWPILLHGFCSLHKLVPTIDTCYLVDGAEGLPGCVRYCASADVPSADGGPVAGARESLLAVDHKGLSYTFEVLDNNIGLKGFVAEMQVSPEEAAAGGGGRCCRVEWSFRGHPLEGWTPDGLVSFLGGTLQLVAKSVVGACGSAADAEGMS